MRSSTILLEIIFGDGPDDFVAALLDFKLIWPQQYANKNIGIQIIVKEAPQVRFTLDKIQHQKDYQTLDLN